VVIVLALHPAWVLAAEVAALLVHAAALEGGVVQWVVALLALAATAGAYVL
jgi:hypothetical protein